VSAPAYVPVERLTLVAPLGLGLWDPTLGRLVSDGLIVRVFDLATGTPRDATPATANRSGVFVTSHLPGLRDREAIGRDEEYFAAGPARPFLVDVRDTLGRYVPFVLRLTLPTRGFVVPSCMADFVPLESPPASPLSPPALPVFAPLFATPSRPVPAGLTAVRASLVDADTGEPAAFALLVVRDVQDVLSGSPRALAAGIADERGEASAILAYPEPPPAPVVSPPASPPAGFAPTPLARQTWSLRVEVWYERGLPRHAPDRTQAALPDLCDLVRQPAATVLTSTSPPVALPDATLRYGEELVLGAEVGAEKLFIRPV